MGGILWAGKAISRSHGSDFGISEVFLRLGDVNGGHRLNTPDRAGHSPDGYSPACQHEWIPRICNKPHGKCTKCKHLPLLQDVLRAHLTGSVTVGLYPLLHDDTCHLLAVDFDKKSWFQDVQEREHIRQSTCYPAPGNIERRFLK
jgi:hypothetical protein